MFGKISLPISLYYDPSLFLLFYVKVQKRIKIPGKITKIIPILLCYDPYFIVLILQPRNYSKELVQICVFKTK